MLALRYARQWRVASLVLLAAVLVATLMPAVWFWSERDDLVSWLTGIDKWLHGFTFAFLALWFSGQYSRRSYWRIALGLLLFGALIEVCQRMVNHRSAEWLDFLANAGGIAAGLGFAAAGLGGWSHRIEALLETRKAGARSE